LFETIRTVKKPWRWLPDERWERPRRWQYRGQMFVIRGTLPPALRDRLGLQWTERDQRRFDRFRSVVRFFGGLVPTTSRSSLVRRIGKLNVWFRAHPRAYRLLGGTTGPGSSRNS
jgi:uncharacterized protein (DUF2236 family)